MYTHTFWQRLKRAIFWNQQNNDHLLHEHEWNRHICWSNPLTTLISLSPLYCCRNWIGCVRWNRKKKKNPMLIKYNSFGTISHQAQTIFCDWQKSLKQIDCKGEEWSSFGYSKTRMIELTVTDIVCSLRMSDADSKCVHTQSKKKTGVAWVSSLSQNYIQMATSHFIRRFSSR